MKHKGVRDRVHCETEYTDSKTIFREWLLLLNLM